MRTPRCRYKAAVDGAWQMFRESFIHVGGSIALNEGSNGMNLSAGLWYPPKSFYLEGDPNESFQNASTVGHKTGEPPAADLGHIPTRHARTPTSHPHLVRRDVRLGLLGQAQPAVPLPLPERGGVRR